MRWTLLAAVLAAALLSLLSTGDEVRAQAGTTTIDVGDNYFCSPAFNNGVCETTLPAGDTVIWEWVGGGDIHSTTECGGDVDACSGPHLWDSPVQYSGSFSFTFDTAGAYAYRCQIHPLEMRGVITVLAVAEPTPTPEPSATEVPAVGETPSAGDSGGPGAAPAVVPDSGGPPPDNGVPAEVWWAVAGGGLVLAAAGVMIARARRS